MSRTKKVTKPRRLRAPLVAAIVLAVLAGGFVISSTSCSKGGKNITVSATPVPTSSLSSSLEDYRGKVVILNFWAVWCGPCRVEIPDFVKLQDKYRSQGFEIVGVSMDKVWPRGGGEATVAPFMKDYNINYTVLLVNDTAALKGYQIPQAIPTTYVLDREGRIVKSYLGPRSMEVFEQDIKPLL
ncbi:MAG TPA: TlpA disulfide reductase family protein [Blastocatellia bacterium]|nr:TlpA disulfide reductase family protein [Blastocatellia bacterium]